MKEDYVSFEIAKLLKEKGLKGQEEHFYEDNKITNFINYWRKITPEQRYEAIEAHTLQMAMKWLREVHNFHVDIATSGENWESHIIELENLSYMDDGSIPICKTYEQAAEEAIKYCLENIIQ